MKLLTAPRRGAVGSLLLAETEFLDEALVAFLIDALEVV
jgi:hypothetical protein